MGADRAERKLTAILAADVAGYSRLMGEDDEMTLASLTAHRRELFDPSIAEHRGRLVKTTGDGLLAEFGSVVDAVRCAVAVQAGMAKRNSDVTNKKRLQFRIGINVGDVVEQDGDLFGDGVNIAARLEAIAEPGGIVISSTVRDHIGSGLGSDIEDIGEQALKNIARPIRAYRLRQSNATAIPIERATLGLPDKPSIAVLPFQNMSGDSEQEYFADGMVEDITTALSRLRWLFVIARNSSFIYKGRSVDVKQVGRELGVRYVLEGSVRKAGARVRITGQLIDTSSGTHLWADRFDGDLADIFELQDQVTSSVVGMIAPKLEQAEIERSKRKPTDSLDAYDYFLRGMAAFHEFTKVANLNASALFARAIELDQNYAAAYGMAAHPEALAYARLLAEACLDIQRIELVKWSVLNRVLNDPEPRPPTIKELTTSLHYARSGMVRVARIRAAQDKIKIGRATKRDREMVEDAPIWSIYFTAKAGAFLESSDGGATAR